LLVEHKCMLLVYYMEETLGYDVIWHQVTGDRILQCVADRIIDANKVGYLGGAGWIVTAWLT
jgi:hypothetical protein